jgi:hypothetical protein
MRLAVAHPGPVLHTPPRARAERLSFDALETVVDIPELSVEEMREVGSIGEWNGSATPVAATSGALWVLVRDNQLDGVPMVLGRTMLEGRAWDRCLASLPAVLHRSPLHVPGNQDHRRPNRGTRIEPSRIGTVGEDLRDAAQRAVKDYAADDLRVRAGMLWTRLPGPFAIRTDDRHSATFRLSTYPFRYVHTWLDTLCAPTMLEEACAFAAGAVARPGSAPEARELKPSLVSNDVRGPLPDALPDLLRFNANAGVTLALDGISRFLRTDAFAPDEQRVVAAAYRAAAAEIGTFLPLASISAIPAERHASVIEAIAGALSRAEASMPRETPSDHWVTRPRRWLADVVLPLARSAVPDEDAAALSELSFG